MDRAPAPNQQNYVIETLRVTWDNLPLLLYGSLLFTIAWLPSFLLNVWGRLGAAVLLGACMIAPAWTALLELEAAALQGHASAGAMLRAIPRFARQSMRLGVALAIPIFICLWSLPFVDSPGTSSPVRFVLAAGLLAVLVLITLYLYAFPLLVLSQQSALSALRNGSILAARYPINTLGLLGMGAIFAFAISYASMALLFFLPALFGMFVVNNCRMLLANELPSSREHKP